MTAHSVLGMTTNSYFGILHAVLTNRSDFEIRFILRSKFLKVYKHICILLPFSEWVIPKIAFLRHEKGSFAFDMFSCWKFILCMKVNVLWCISVGGDGTSILSFLGLRTCTAEVRVFLQLTSLASWLLQICCSCM